MRSHIETIPDGTYAFTDHIDSDGIEWVPLAIRLEMTVKGSDVHLDFSRSSPPCRGPLNSVRSTTMAGVYIAIKHIFPDVPINAGCFTPFTFDLPETTFLNAQPPRPVAGCASEVCQRIIDVVFGALSQAIPERCYAAPMGTVTNLSVGGDDPEHGPYVFYSFIGGGYGGNYLTDGLTNGNPTIALARTQALEIFEARYPVLFTRYTIREGSAGAGQRRGGFGVIFRVSAPPGTGRRVALGGAGALRPLRYPGRRSGRARQAHLRVAGRGASSGAHHQRRERADAAGRHPAPGDARRWWLRRPPRPPPGAGRARRAAWLLRLRHRPVRLRRRHPGRTTGRQTWRPRHGSGPRCVPDNSHPSRLQFRSWPLFSSARERRLWLWTLAVVVAIYSTLGLSGDTSRGTCASMVCCSRPRSSSSSSA